MAASILEHGPLGIGTWYIGEHPQTRSEEIAAIRYALDNGITLIDTAEMYGNGRSEQLVGEAIAPYQRDRLYIVSKVLPSNANRKRMEDSLDASLKRLGTDYLDTYLYHWRGGTPLEETVLELTRLQQKGKIKAWGVSNFDVDDMEELLAIPHGDACSTNQVLYHLGSRGIEYSLKPFQDQRKIPTMAYCPLAQAGTLKREMLQHPVITQIAKQREISVYQVLLCFVLAQPNTIAIPRTSKVEHMKELVACRDIHLTSSELEQLNQAYPAPQYKVFLDMQ